MVWTNPRTWVAGEKPTAATLNQHIRDNFRALGDPWTAYSPTWTGSGGNPAIGNGSIDASYRQNGKTVDFRITITMGSTTTYGSGSWSITLPVTPGPGTWLFVGVARSSNSDWIAGELLTPGSPSLLLRAMPTTAGANLRSVTPTVPVTWASTYSLSISGTYEAA